MIGMERHRMPFIGSITVVLVALLFTVLHLQPTSGADLNDTRPCQSAQERHCMVLLTQPKNWSSDSEPLPEPEALHSSHQPHTEDPLSNSIYPTRDLRKNASIVIDPPWVRRGGSAYMRCDYELDAPLYAVKWYRGHMEFYRYTPSEHPSSKTFHHNEIKIDISASNASHVMLRNVGFNLAGIFQCEVTADGPPFLTLYGRALLTVVELPHTPPMLYTERDRYDVGDILQANCTTAPSRPNADINFYINDIPVSTSSIVRHTFDETLQWTSRELVMQILPSHVVGPLIMLRCAATIGIMYDESTDAPLNSARKEPIPERVTSHSTSLRMPLGSTALAATIAFIASQHGC